MAEEENWDTEQVDLTIDNCEKLYLAKQKLLWNVMNRVTPFDAQRFVKSWRDSIDAESRQSKITITWGNVQYHKLAETWSAEMLDLKPRTLDQVFHLAEMRAARHREVMPLPGDHRDMSPFKPLRKSLGEGYESDCACLALSMHLGVDCMYIKLPMPNDYCADCGARNENGACSESCGA